MLQHSRRTAAQPRNQQIRRLPEEGPAQTNRRRPPVIDLSRAPGSGEAWGRPRAVVYLWSACELLFVSNPWQVSSRLRVAVLRAFGADIADGVIFRPRTRVKSPWKLHIGERTWIGEGVWFHNQDHIHVGSDVVISQETFLTTGSHRVRTDMGLITSPISRTAGASSVYCIRPSSLWVRPVMLPLAAQAYPLGTVKCS